MDQPLGKAVGNILEVHEAIDTLRGQGPEDFTELCLTLGSQMLICGGRADTAGEARDMLQEAVQSGRAMKKLADLVEAQGGSRESVWHPETLKKAPLQIEISAPDSGYIRHIACDEVGMCSLMLGGGREKKEDTIDLTVGLELRRKAGDYVKIRISIAVMHAGDQKRAAAAQERFLKAIEIGPEKPARRPLIVDIIR